MTILYAGLLLGLGGSTSFAQNGPHTPITCDGIKEQNALVWANEGNADSFLCLMLENPSDIDEYEGSLNEYYESYGIADWRVDDADAAYGHCIPTRHAYTTQWYADDRYDCDVYADLSDTAASEGHPIYQDDPLEDVGPFTAKGFYCYVTLTIDGGTTCQHSQYDVDASYVYYTSDDTRANHSVIENDTDHTQSDTTLQAQFKTLPTSANPAGDISADFDFSQAISTQYSLEDDDMDTGLSPSISLASAGSPLSISLSTSRRDDHETGVALAWGYESDGGIGSNLFPSTTKYEYNSNNLSNTPVSGGLHFVMSRSGTVRKPKDEVVNCAFATSALTYAYTSTFWPYPWLDCEGTHSVVWKGGESSSKYQVSNVKFISDVYGTE